MNFKIFYKCLVHELEISVISGYLYIINDWFGYKQAYVKLLNDRIKGEKRQKGCISQRVSKSQQKYILRTIKVRENMNTPR